jgi:hypothetical protein
MRADVNGGYCAGLKTERKVCNTAAEKDIQYTILEIS